MNGFWTAKFSTPLGAGFGVAYFTDHEVFGGDSGFTYTGNYDQNGSSITAQLQIKSFGAGTPSVFGPGSTFELSLVGQLQGTSMTAQGTASHAPGLTFGVVLTKVR